MKVHRTPGVGTSIVLATIAAAIGVCFLVTGSVVGWAWFGLALVWLVIAVRSRRASRQAPERSNRQKVDRQATHAFLDEGPDQV